MEGFFDAFKQFSVMFIMMIGLAVLVSATVIGLSELGEMFLTVFFG